MMNYVNVKIRRKEKNEAEIKYDYVKNNSSKCIYFIVS